VSASWCRAPSGSAWGGLLARGLVRLSRRAALAPISGADDGHDFFAALYSKAFSGVVEVDAATSAYRPVHRFIGAVPNGVSGSFDGRWLVWAEYDNAPGNLSAYGPVWSWDSKTGRARQIGGARSSSGWVSAPDALDGFATWAQSSSGAEKVYVIDLASDRSRVVDRGYTGTPFLAGDGLVVWPEETKMGALVGVRAAIAATGHPSAVPPALAGVTRAPVTPASDGSAVAYTNAAEESLLWSPSVRSSPQRVFVAPGKSLIDNDVQVGQGHVAFTIWPVAYLADSRAGRYVEISNVADAVLDNESLVLVRPPEGKAAHPVRDVIFLPLSSVPAFAACSR
jgi:hypothetical protein